MSDPKATPMTLEEAVEIVRHGYDGHVFAELRRNENASPSDLMAEWDRACAIVDQALKAHKALTQYADLPATAAIHDQFGAKDKWTYEFQKLRALERGESEVQP